jgi:hypothetical protein
VALRPIKRWEKPFGKYICQWPQSTSTCTRVYYIAKYQWTHFFEMLNKCSSVLVRYFNRSYERNRVQKENKSTFRTRIRFIFSENFFSKHFYVRFYIICLLVWISANVFTFCLLFSTILFRHDVYSTLHARRNVLHWNIETQLCTFLQ